jgi:hypothetical protein
MPRHIPPNAPSGLKEENFAYTFIDHKGNVWDVYHFLTEGHNINRGKQPVTLSFRFDKPKRTWFIGLLCAGFLTKEEAFAKTIEETTPKKKENP